MKKISAIFLFFISCSLYSQDNKCNVPSLQFETYDFAISNLKNISKNITDKNSLIEVTIQIEYKSINKIKYNIISPENNYSGENKVEIKVWKGLNNFITKNINLIIKNCPNFNYERIVYRIPLSKENIQKAIEEVNKSLIFAKEKNAE
ncbi:hypothetical protein [Flavobacterium aciduliphilum]|uniref:Uncharacterized protein n=1 Tax=Flavobacterium aciduliphilum TaxID=1101402 RepID=A0A328YF23_9FLAO|nr:hypothetical protein [Flavobacterium aciduliphilum]RAR70622.1 hypothetical protein CLV55_11022 [Flavobacterium aciduliphilum]